MLRLLFLSLISLASAAVFARNGFTLSGHHIQSTARRDTTIGPTVTLPLWKSSDRAPSQKYLRALEIGLNGTARLRAAPYAFTYLATVQFGNQAFNLTVDTGSADTWVVQDRFRCADPISLDLIAQDKCRFGPRYTPSATLKQILDQNFKVVYGDGEMLAGYMATESVGLANITIPDQTIGVVSLAAYWGDGVASGLLGLAYPNMTQAYPGNDPFADDVSFGKNIAYNTFFTNMYESRGVFPVFSIALNRNSDSAAGSLTLGGISKDVPYDGDFVSTPIKMMRGTYATTNGTSESAPFFAFYTIDVTSISSPNASAGALAARSEERIVFDRSESRGRATKRSTLDLLFERQSNATKGGVPPPTHAGPDVPSPQQNAYSMVVDSGTTILYLPDNIADAINMAFNPPAECDPWGDCYVSCDAVAPRIGITINGTEFFINPADMILNNVSPKDPDVPVDLAKPCSSGVSPAGDGGLFILGDVFLKNVLAVFDVGQGEMRFAARENY